MTAITNGQLELRAGTPDALVVGDGTAFLFTPDGPGWWAAPEVRTSDTPRSDADGYTPGRDLLGKHVTNLVLEVLADSELELGDLIEDWKAATAKISDELVVVRANLLGRTRLRYGRFRTPGEVDGARARKGLMGTASAQFEALDARDYGDDLHEATVGRTIAGSGFTVPFTVPFTLGASTSGSVAVVNQGRTPTPWTGRLDGPLTNPTITHVDFNRRLAFTANGGLSLAAGEYLELSSKDTSALLLGTSDRRTLLTLDSQWWEFGAGTQEVRLDADAGDGTLTINWRDAYFS